MAGTGADVQYLGTPASGSIAYGGGGTQTLKFRDPLDARRAMLGERVPSAEYPDGYLGTIRSRREDRMLDAVKNRLTDRSYQRGVHKGERLPSTDYFWKPEFNPQTSLKYEARGERWNPRGDVTERLNYLDTYAARTPDEMAVDRVEALTRYRVQDLQRSETDPTYRQAMSRMLPTWK